MSIVADPRSGEILRAEIQLFEGAIKLYRRRAIVQLLPSLRGNERPAPTDSIIGMLLSFGVSHEIGHVLGLRHNFKASSYYPIDSIRNRAFVRRMGFTASIMDYARMNWVAQPEDDMALSDLIASLGPYDEFAINWGYRVVPTIAHVEGRVLDSIAALQDRAPHLRSETSRLRVGERGWSQEAIGDADPVKATELGLRNLQRAAHIILRGSMDQMISEPPDRLYEELVAQWSTELTQVLELIGSWTTRELRGSQSRRVIASSLGEQLSAVAFLSANAFTVPAFLSDTAFHSLISSEAASRLILRRQELLLRALLAGERLERLAAQTAAGPFSTTPDWPSLVLSKVREGLWSELDQANVIVREERRALQELHMQMLLSALAQSDTAARASSTTSSISTGFESRIARVRAIDELRRLRRAIEQASPRSQDALTAAHLMNAMREIDRRLRRLAGVDAFQSSTRESIMRLNK